MYQNLPRRSVSRVTVAHLYVAPSVKCVCNFVHVSARSQGTDICLYYKRLSTHDLAVHGGPWLDCTLVKPSVVWRVPPWRRSRSHLSLRSSAPCWCGHRERMRVQTWCDALHSWWWCLRIVWAACRRVNSCEILNGDTDWGFGVSVWYVIFFVGAIFVWRVEQRLVELKVSSGDVSF